jgi:NAD(P)-dependent dehydrogenase (short-subunit alcohol dehydrogenase family)
MAFEGVNALVTGGASGLGRAFCEELGRRRAKVLVTDVDIDGAHETVRRIESAGGRGRAVEADVSSLQRMEEVAEEAEDYLGGVELLVNNAGIGAGGPFSELTMDVWRRTIDINLWGVIYGCHLFAPKMEARGRGYIVNVASAAGLLAAPEMAPYNVTKAGVVSLSETLHAELGPKGVHVTALCPTFFRTRIMEKAAGIQDPEMKKIVERLMDRSKIQAPHVAQSALEAVYDGQLYAVPMRDGRMFWRLKRALPQSYAKIVSQLTRDRFKKYGKSR